MGDLSDAALLARFRTGDETALETLLLRYETPLFQFLVGLLRDEHQAEDVLQETFVRALERSDDAAPGHWRGWLFTVAYHQAMLARRKAKSRPADPLADPPAVADPGRPPDLEAAGRDDARRLQQLLARLPVAYREVIRQRVWEGKPFKEIAAALGCPLNTALGRMHEGLKRLRTLWEKDHA